MYLRPFLTICICSFLSACQAPIQWGLGATLLQSHSDFKGSIFSGSVDDRDMGYSVHFEADPGVEDHVVWTAGYTQGGDTEFDGLFDGVTDTGDIETELASVTVGYHHPVNEHVTLGGHVGASYFHVEESEVYAGIPERNSASGVSPTVGVQANCRITPKWTLGITYDRHFDVGKKGATGEGDFDTYGLRVERKLGR